MENFKNTLNSNLLKSEVLGKILFPSSVINDKISELGNRITEDYSGKDLILISVLRGGVIFVTDLARKIDIDLTIDFMSISSYHGIHQTSTGIVKITKDLEDSIEGKDVIIVEDIIDTGLTISYLLRNLKSRYPGSIEICTLLDRNVRRIANINIKYIGFSIGEEYVVGYGLDYKQKYRNLDSIYELKLDMVKKDIEHLQNKPVET
ncbi:MAG: hypoxanthine phosphoribosyltransferase [Actinobacteria bacterium]|nr:hypoxanthine phosphoribosyltransferase [Actinomycetota bacterium]MCG2788320.1 hypoxanthine phosphoribosyltransferase [Actinomycetes bacterium]